MPKVEEKKNKERDGGRRNLRRWIVVGVISVLVVVGMIIALVYTFQSVGLRGVSFSAESGFYESDIDLEIKPGGWFLTQPIGIKYTMNGDDLENTNDLYSRAIKLEVPEEGYKLYTIKATACKEDDECTEPEVATYVLGKNLDEDVTIDIVNVNSSQKSLYDYDVGIMVGGRTFDENVAAGEQFAQGNYNNRGKAWMRDAFITRFDNNGDVVWNQDVHIGVSGGTSSAYDVKSIKVSMELQNGNSKTLRLRSGSQDRSFGNIRSSVVDRLAEESGFDGRTGTKRVVMFLNGDYYGIFDMQDTFSEQNLLQKFQLSKKKNVEKVTGNGTETDVFRIFGVREDFWDDLDLAENRERIEKLVDMDNYLKFYAIMIMVNDTDWPMNNFAAWRYVGGENENNKYEDGRIRFLIRDTDIIYHTDGDTIWFEGATGDTFRAMMDSKYRGAGSSFRKVMKSNYYRQRFIELLRELINGPFATENVLKIIDEEAAKIEHQVKLFSSAEEYEEWKEQIEILKKTASERERQMRRNVREYFDTEL